MNIRRTNFALESFAFDGVEKIPIFEVRKNPHTRRWAVFYKIGPYGQWKELTEMSGSTMGEPSTPIVKRTRFKFVAEHRLVMAHVYAVSVDNRRATENIFLPVDTRTNIRREDNAK